MVCTIMVPSSLMKGDDGTGREGRIQHLGVVAERAIFMQRTDGYGNGARESVSANVHMGRPARRVLGAGQGSVLAGFASAIYIESAAGVACLVPPTAPRGPLNVVLPAFRPGTPELPGAAWRTDGTTLAIDGHGTFAVSPHEAWTPARLASTCPAALAAGIASMGTALMARAARGDLIVHALACNIRQPVEFTTLFFGAENGFRGKPERCFFRDSGVARHRGPLAWNKAVPPRPPAALVEAPAIPGSGVARRPRQRSPASLRGHPSAPVTGAASRPGSIDAHFTRAIPALSRWLDDALAGRGPSTPGPVVDLLGAGRGLTPSGDDCIVGVLVALHALGERRVGALVADTVARCAPRRTSRLSAAHLAAACAGEAIEPVHAAIEAVAGHASPGPALDALDEYGHGSGFDALAGVLIAASAIAHSRASA